MRVFQVRLTSSHKAGLALLLTFRPRVKLDETHCRIIQKRCETLHRHTAGLMALSQCESAKPAIV
jgi:hypothetical protein